MSNEMQPELFAIIQDEYPYEYLSVDDKITIVERRMEVLEQFHFQALLLHQEASKGAAIETTDSQESAEYATRLSMLRAFRSSLTTQRDASTTI